MDRYTLQDGVNDLYRTARTQQATTSTKRLQDLAAFCCQEFAARGLTECRIDPEIPGFGRAKDWDVVWFHSSKARLALSLKSLLTNLAGTVPNRIDDLMGEAANLQLYSPEIVIGYLMIFNVEKDYLSPKHGCTWAELLRSRLASISGRRAPHWTIGTVEASAFVEVSFATGPALISGIDAVTAMLDTLTEQVYLRNPGLSRPQNQKKSN